MAESTLSLGYSDFQSEVGRLVWYGSAPASWSSAQTAEVDSIIQSGLRQFYSPPPVQGRVHHWSFLEPWYQLTTTTDYSTGTVSSSSTNVTLTGGVWPAWAATNGRLVVANTTYSIASKTSDSIIVLSSAPSTPFSSNSFVLVHNGNYTLPDNFGVMDGPLYYSSDLQYEPIQIKSDKYVMHHRSISDIVNRPCFAALSYGNSTTSTSGQRLTLMFYPRPDAAYVLNFKYKVILDKISSSYPYAYGSALHSETLLESILSIAEQRCDNKSADHTSKWIERLVTSIEMDAANVPDNLGYNSDNSDMYDQNLHFRDTIYGLSNTVTYNNLIS